MHQYIELKSSSSCDSKVYLIPKTDADKGESGTVKGEQILFPVIKI